MPLGLVRLNERHQRPNQNISFIRPMDTPDKEIVQDILERVSAIVWPIMRDNHLGVMTLEDFPPNREFLGRNFNAGEVIQLVLKSYTTGQWLPFQFVCTVMLHELAHIKHMNHSRYFHQVRLGYHKEFDALVARNYTGEGFWSQGKALSAGVTGPRHLSEAEMPENLCGGTYRTAQKPQKRKLTYAEQKQRRIEKRFGKGEGIVTGGDEKLRASLEKGKSKKAVATKPRVAQSQRGRDLRLEAALRRQQAQKDAAESSSSTPKNEASSEDGSDYETEEEEETVDVGGGNRLVRVDEQGDDADEWDDLREEMNKMLGKGADAVESSSTPAAASPSLRKGKGKAKAIPGREEDNGRSGRQTKLSFGPDARKNGQASSATPLELDDGSATDPSDSDDEVEMLSEAPRKQPKIKEPPSESDGDTPPPPARQGRPSSSKPSRLEDAPPSVEIPIGPDERGIVCSMCTTLNDEDRALCAVCANVLRLERTPNWKCLTLTCQGSSYVNSADAGICGCCGERRTA